MNLDEQGLGRFIEEHYKEPGDRLFRMERLPVYNVPAQAAELARWRAGALEPNWEVKRPWLDTLAAESARRMVSRRVRIFGRELTDDEQMSCHWGYALNSAYEDIRVLREGEHDIPAGLIPHDYWLINDRFAVPMSYDQEGRFLGAEVLPRDRLAEYVADSERAWAAAEPFTTWWERHGELRRRAA